MGFPSLEILPIFPRRSSFGNYVQSCTPREALVPNLEETVLQSTLRL